LPPPSRLLTRPRVGKDIFANAAPWAFVSPTNSRAAEARSYARTARAALIMATIALLVSI